MDGSRDFDEFVAAQRGALMAQAIVLAGSAPGAEDLVQEALIRAWIRWGRVSQLDNPAAWVRRVLYNISISEWRKQRVRRTYRHAPPVPPVSPDPDSRAEAVAEALRQLPDLHRRALLMHHAAGMPVQEIAAELQVPEGTVRSWLSRGRTALAALLEIDDAARPRRHHG